MNDQVRDLRMDTDYEEGEVLSDADKGSSRMDANHPKADGKRSDFPSTIAQAPRPTRKSSPPTSVRSKLFHV